MPLASPAIKLEHEFRFNLADGGQITCTRSDDSTVVYVDRSQARAVPHGTQILHSFLDEFEADAGIAELLPIVRRDVGDELEEAIGRRTLRTLRLKMGLSQIEFANALGTSQSSVSLLEARQQKPGEDMIRRIAGVLEVDFNTLMEALANG